MFKKILLLSTLGTFLTFLEGSNLMAMEQSDHSKDLSRQERIAAMKIKRKAAMSQDKNSSIDQIQREQEKEEVRAALTERNAQSEKEYDIPSAPLPPTSHPSFAFEEVESGEKEASQESPLAQLLQNKRNSLKKVEPTSSLPSSSSKSEDNPLAGAFGTIDKVKESSSDNESDEEWGDEEGLGDDDLQGYGLSPAPLPPLPSQEKKSLNQNHETQPSTQQPPATEPPFDPTNSIKARRGALGMSLSTSDEVPVYQKKEQDEDDDLFTVEGD